MVWIFAVLLLIFVIYKAVGNAKNYKESSGNKHVEELKSSCIRNTDRIKPILRSVSGPMTKDTDSTLLKSVFIEVTAFITAIAYSHEEYRNHRDLSQSTAVDVAHNAGSFSTADYNISYKRIISRRNMYVKMIRNNDNPDSIVSAFRESCFGLLPQQRSISGVGELTASVEITDCAFNIWEEFTGTKLGNIV